MTADPACDQTATATILIVEDDRAIIEFIAEVFIEFGYRPLCAAHGEQALAITQDEHVDLLLTDIRMPGIDGPELVRRIRAENSHLPVVLMSAHRYNIPAELRHIPFVGKPFEIYELLDLVDTLLEQRPS
jgi:two-component system response regulator MprA